MKATGVTRKIDELGRVVIPKEIRRNLGIRDGENLEIYTNDDSIILKKYNHIQNYEELCLKICNIFSNISNCNVIISDRENVIATNDEISNIIGEKLDKSLLTLIDNRENKIYENMEKLKFINENIEGFLYIVPIISSIDSLGLVIIVSNKFENYELIAKMIAKILSDKIDIS